MWIYCVMINKYIYQKNMNTKAFCLGRCSLLLQRANDSTLFQSIPFLLLNFKWDWLWPSPTYSNISLKCFSLAGNLYDSIRLTKFGDFSFHHFGKKLKVLGCLLRAYFVLCQIWTYNQNKFCYWANLHRC